MEKDRSHTQEEKLQLQLLDVLDHAFHQSPLLKLVLSSNTGVKQQIGLVVRFRLKMKM
jgi:hypothetical protein